MSFCDIPTEQQQRHPYYLQLSQCSQTPTDTEWPSTVLHIILSLPWKCPKRGMQEPVSTTKATMSISHSSHPSINLPCIVMQNSNTWHGYVVGYVLSVVLHDFLVRWIHLAVNGQVHTTQSVTWRRTSWLTQEPTLLLLSSSCVVRQTILGEALCLLYT